MFNAPGAGFGAPAAGGFGAAAPAAGFGAKAPAAAGGFGAPAAGGFGAPAAGGFGAAAPAAGFGAKAPAAAGGFGAPPAAGGFGAPAAGGFGAPAAGGFGAPAAGGFGAPAAGGFGVPAAGGFGAPAAGGFGAPAAGGFGVAPPAMAAQAAALQKQQQAIDAVNRHAPGRNLTLLDEALSALHPNCRFRSFVYNICQPGKGEEAERRVRYGMWELGGGAREEQWLRANRLNPDPETMYPDVIHFFHGLLQRATRQHTTTQQLVLRSEEVKKKIQLLRAINADNAKTYRALSDKRRAYEMLLLGVMAKAETVRQTNLPEREEKRTVTAATAKLQLHLQRPGQFRSALQELEPHLQREVDAARMNDAPVGSGGRPAARPRRSQEQLETLQEWQLALSRTARAVEALAKAVASDAAMVAGDAEAQWS